MALKAQTKINTYDVESYRVVESVQFTKQSGASGTGRVTVHTADYPSASLAKISGVTTGGTTRLAAFNKRAVPVNPEVTTIHPIVTENPDGTTTVTPVPDMPAYKDLAGAPLSALAPQLLGPGETLEGLTLHDLVYRFGYLVADKIPDNHTAAKV